MYLPKTNSYPVLPFCDGCPFAFTKRCKGPENLKSFVKNDESVHGCIEPSQREKAFSDTYDRTPVPYLTSHQRTIKLPTFIPEVKTGLNLENCKEIEVFAISLGNIVGTKGNMLVNSVEVLRKRYQLPKTCKIVLIGTAKDEKLQKLWANSDRLKVWEHIANMGFDFITGFSFSVWDEDPRTDQIVNQDRNFLTHDYFANLGVPTIPFVFSYNDDDYESFGKWMMQRPDLNTVAIFASSYSKEKNFLQLLVNMRKFQLYAKRKLKFLVIGASTKEKIRKLMSEFDVCIVASKPFQAAKSGEICTDELKYEKHEELTRDELAQINFRKNLSYCNSFKKLTKKTKLKVKKEIYNYAKFRKMELSNLYAT
jgi:Domain of unknown function (DUF4417)